MLVTPSVYVSRQNEIFSTIAKLTGYTLMLAWFLDTQMLKKEEYNEKTYWH